MGVPTRAIESEVERFKSLTARFRDKVNAGTTVGEDDTERERVYDILVSINEFLEQKLRNA